MELKKACNRYHWLILRGLEILYNHFKRQV